MSNLSRVSAYNRWKENLSAEERAVIKNLSPELRHATYLGIKLASKNPRGAGTDFSEQTPSERPSSSLDEKQCHEDKFTHPDSVNPPGSEANEPTSRKRARVRNYDLRPPRAPVKEETRPIAPLRIEHRLDPHSKDFDTLKVCQEGNLLVEFFFVTRKLVEAKKVSTNLIMGDGPIPGIPNEKIKPLQLKFLEDLKVSFGPIHSELAEEFSRAEDLLGEIAAIWEIQLPAEEGWSARLNIGASESFNHRFLSAVADAFKSLGSIEDDTLSLVKMAFVGHLMMLTPENLLTGRLSHMPAIIEFYRNLVSRVVVPFPERYNFRWDFLLDCLFLGIAFPPECGLRRLIQGQFLFNLPFFSWDSWKHPTKVFWLQIGLYLIKARLEIDWCTQIKNFAIAFSEEEDALSSAQQ